MQTFDPTKPYAKITVTGHAASELDIAAEGITIPGDCSTDDLVKQWTGRYVVAYSAEHAGRLAAIACEWSNELDRDSDDIDATAYDRRRARSASKGLSTLYGKLAAVSR